MENVNFSTFWTSYFYSLERCFFVLEYRKRHFTALYCLKKICWKNGHFFPKPWVNPFGKMAIFQLFEPFFYSLERRFFVLEYRKGHFPMLYCRKKKDGKMAIFGPKPWVNPFWKMSVFRLFGRLVFIA